MKVLVACEESQAVTKELRKLGHEAYSCDLLPCSGGHPEWHFNCDIFEVIQNFGGELQNGDVLESIDEWEMMVAHPPCTYLSVSGAKWYYHPDDKDLPTSDRRPHPRFPNRAKHRDEALDFFIKLMSVPIDRIAIENPVGIISTKYRKPNQIVQPWMFGDEATKTTCFWTKNLPDLEPTKIVGKGERITFKSGKSQPKWYSDALTKAKTNEERQTLRSKTFPGLAKAIAKQWSS
jgi:hypothetical protein